MIGGVVLQEILPVPVFFVPGRVINPP